MKLASWNVNSIKVRLPQLLDWLAAAQPDVVCLQELKTEDAGFPREALEAAGYACAVSGQKTYNGVAHARARAARRRGLGHSGIR
jgi:exodeoxyribonuclease III